MKMTSGATDTPGVSAWAILAALGAVEAEKLVLLAQGRRRANSASG